MGLSEEQEVLKNYFENQFKNPLIITSPGRINLIGEHIDYHGGYVLPAAINKSIQFEFSKNKTASTVHIFNKNFNEYSTINLEHLETHENHWQNYIVGVLFLLIEAYPNTISGFDITVSSNLPMGSGLSSSAALECGIAKGVTTLFNINIEPNKLVRLCQKAEHDFANTNCGIMDQFSVYMSKKNHFILLNCETLEHEFISNNFDPYCLVLLNTNIKHSHSESGYNERRQESENALKIISKQFPEVTQLVNATKEQVETLKHQLTMDEADRATHVIEEQERVILAVEAMKKNDLETLGKLLYASHNGLQNHYKVSCPELDFLVEFSKTNNQVLGARMMGGGFGGSTINLVHQDAVNIYIKDISEAYKLKYNIELTPILVTTSDGTSIKK